MTYYEPNLYIASRYACIHHDRSTTILYWYNIPNRIVGNLHTWARVLYFKRYTRYIITQQ